MAKNEIYDLPLVVDQYDDSGALLRKTFAGRGTPPVIAASLNAVDAVKHPEDYALVVKTASGLQYKYPCVDAGNTVASALYLAEHGHGLPPELEKVAAAKITEALVSFGFDAPDDLEKVAAADLAYDPAADEHSLRALFGFSEDDMFEEAAGELDNLSPGGKRRVAMQVKEAGVLSDYRGDTFGTNLPLALDIRAMRVAHDAEALVALVALKEKRASVTPEVFAEELYTFDIDHGLTHKYGTTLPDPHISVFGSNLIKEASAADVEVDGRTYGSDDVAAFATEGKDELVSSFGEDFYGQFADNPVTVLASLPLNHKQAIARMMDART